MNNFRFFGLSFFTPDFVERPLKIEVFFELKDLTFIRHAISFPFILKSDKIFHKMGLYINNEV